MPEVYRCEGCGKAGTFRILVPDKGFEYRCDTCTKRKMDDVYRRFGLVLNVHPLKEEGAAGGGVGGWL